MYKVTPAPLQTFQWATMLLTFLVNVKPECEVKKRCPISLFCVMEVFFKLLQFQAPGTVQADSLSPCHDLLEGLNKSFIMKLFFFKWRIVFSSNAPRFLC